MKVDNEENLNDNIKKYNNIMQQYRNGKFGEENLTLKEILVAAGEPNLLNEMTISEIQYLCDHSSGMLKSMFSSLQKKKLLRKQQ